MRSVALTTELHAELSQHLNRPDGQEDLCFALWHPSQGRDRLTALIDHPVLPQPGERNLHGNASFEPEYFTRALAIASERGAGLAFAHSHPNGRGWQGMSPDDIRAEQDRAAQVLAATGRPLVGLTLAGRDDGWSARFWERTAPRTYQPVDCEVVRVVGERLRVTYHEPQRPQPAPKRELARTISAWGENAQADLARLRIGVVGAGSVGALVAESLARTGIERLRLIDFDAVEYVNLDRLLHATAADAEARRAKVEVLVRELANSATASRSEIEPLEYSIVEEAGFRAALDCDVLFSCVDKPWPRYVLNLIAYAHLIPVIDGGIAVERTPRGTMRGTTWKAHTAAPGRQCLECLEQYDPGLVQTERDGFLDDPSYIERLPDDHPLKRNENVFSFSMACASLELAQLTSMVVAPAGIADYGAQSYHLPTGTITLNTDDCHAGCPFTGPLLARGDDAGVGATGFHKAAHEVREARAAIARNQQGLRCASLLHLRRSMLTAMNAVRKLGWA